MCRHRTILRGSLDYAIEALDILTVNPADRATLPRNSKKRVPTYYNADQLKKLFRLVQGESIEVPVILSATYGLRRSEALGLQWDGVKIELKICFRLFQIAGLDDPAVFLVLGNVWQYTTIRF